MRSLVTHFESPIGLMRIAATEKGIDEIHFVRAREGDTPGVHAAMKECVLQIAKYFEGTLQTFHSLPLAMHGTDFQQRVWDALLKIPYAETISYGELAQKIGDKSSARAIGNALNANPLQIIIPCHRVIRSTGERGEYASGRDVKEWLLEHERMHRKVFSHQRR